MAKPQKYLLAGVGILAVGLIAFVLLFNFGNGGKIVRTSGTALVGGPFSLVDQNSKPFTEKDLKGKYSLIYFGYTYCPDVCPTELQVMTGALEQLGDLAKQIQPVFISIDPARDTPAVMKEYVSNFYPGMIGLTGTPAQIAAVAKEYRVYYAKAAEKGASKDDYTMDHSSIIYLMDPDGKFIKHFSYGTDATKLANGIKVALGK